MFLRYLLLIVVVIVFFVIIMILVKDTGDSRKKIEKRIKTEHSKTPTISSKPKTPSKH